MKKKHIILLAVLVVIAACLCLALCLRSCAKRDEPSGGASATDAPAAETAPPEPDGEPGNEPGGTASDEPADSEEPEEADSPESGGDARESKSEPVNLPLDEETGLPVPGSYFPDTSDPDDEDDENGALEVQDNYVVYVGGDETEPGG